MCYCKPSSLWVQEARVTWRSRAEVAEKHLKTAENAILNINSPVCPARGPFFPDPRHAGGPCPAWTGQRGRIPGNW